MHANGVPWLVWIDRDRWVCEACGESGHLPAFNSVLNFAAALGDLKRIHWVCVPEDERPHPPGIGDVLNNGISYPEAKDEHLLRGRGRGPQRRDGHCPGIYGVPA
jgi:hypothetical protein